MGESDYRDYGRVCSHQRNARKRDVGDRADVDDQDDYKLLS